MKRRVAIFVPTLEGGGAERVMVTLANRLLQTGYSVDMLLVNARGPYVMELMEGVNVVDFRAKRSIGAIVGLVKYFREARPFVVLSALRHANVIVTASALLARTGVRVVVSERSAVRGDGKAIADAVVILLARWLYSFSNAVVAVSEGVRSDVINKLGVEARKVTVIHNPLDLERIATLAAEPCIHAWMHDEDAPVFLAVGRLSPVKGFDTLLEAFALVRQKRRARLVILGEGEQRNELVAMVHRLGVEEDVELVGFQNNPFKWMAGSQVFVLSSVSEGLPNSLLQAMACGVRVVSTDCEHGPSEILEDGVWGHLVPVGDVAALAGAMEEALEGEGPDVLKRAADFALDRSVAKYAMVMGLGT